MVPERSKARGKRSRHLGSGCPGRALLPQVFLKYQPTSHRQQFINNYLFVAATPLSSFITLAICQSHKHDSLNLIYLCRLRILALIARVYWRRVEKKSAKGKSRPASLYNVSSLMYHPFYIWVLTGHRNSTLLSTPESYWGQFEEISKYNTHLNVVERLWTAWYAWMQNDVLATGIMSFVMHEIVYFGRSLPWIFIDTLGLFKNYKIQSVRLRITEAYLPLF